jgi:hypothetical protein
MKGVRRCIVCCTAAGAVLAACERRADPVGVWELWSVDGQTIDAGIQQRIEVPAEVADEVAGEIWTESYVLGGELDLREDGTFVETQVQRQVLVVSAEAYEDLTGEPWEDAEPYREDQGTDTLTFTGNWSITRDSLLIRPSPEDARSEVAAQLRAVFPQATEAELQAVVDSALLAHTIPPRFIGAAARDRLEGRDVDGRLVIFRRRR